MNTVQSSNRFRTVRRLGASAAVLSTALAGCSSIQELLGTSQFTSASVNNNAQAAVQPEAAQPQVQVAPTEQPQVTYSLYQDGQYLSDAIPADHWGNMQVQVIIQNGVIADIQVVDYPRSTNHSDMISRSALPTLLSEAITNQSANVNIVSRATDTSVAFIQALQTALDDAMTAGSASF